MLHRYPSQLLLYSSQFTMPPGKVQSPCPYKYVACRKAAVPPGILPVSPAPRKECDGSPCLVLPPAPPAPDRLPPALLALALTASVSAAVITSVVSQKASSLAPGVTYQYQDVKTGQGPQKVHTISFPLGGPVDMRLGLSNGKIRGNQNVLDMAKQADANGDVLAAINGSFFKLGASYGGIPFSFLMQDGELYVSPPVPGQPPERQRTGRHGDQ